MDRLAGQRMRLAGRASQRLLRRSNARYDEEHAPRGKKNGGGAPDDETPPKLVPMRDPRLLYRGHRAQGRRQPTLKRSSDLTARKIRHELDGLDAPLQAIDFIGLDGCLDGASTVSSVVCKPLKP